MTAIKYRTADVDGFNIFYREAGAAGAPKLLLLHGFPSASHMFRDLIPLLADRFHLVAPDLPGFGRSNMPSGGHTFDGIAETIDRFTEVVGFNRYAVYVFDYGAPTGFRLAVKHPDRITAIISQNGNAYEEGLSDGWNPIRAYWQNASQANREALRKFLRPRRPCGNTCTASPTRRRSRRMDTRSMTSICADPGRPNCSSTCSGTTRATSRSTRPSRSISAPPSRPSWQCGARTTRSSCRKGPRRSARHSGRGLALLRHRAFRAGDPRRRDCGGHSRIPSPLISQPGGYPRRRAGGPPITWRAQKES